MKKFIKKYWLDILILLLILGLSPFFFYKLGQSSLVSWDEAWYASIAKNMVKSGNFITLVWNGYSFFDHPVAGFWWMAISFKILGISNLAARMPSAIFGISTLLVTFFVGRKMFNRWVGFASAVALSSAPWFLYRSRSGNLDIFLTFFFVLSIYLAVKSVENKKFYIPLGISLGLLFLTKTGIPFVIIPALIAVYWGRKINWKWVLGGISGFVALFGSWFVAQTLTDVSFIQRYIYIGTPGLKNKTSLIDNIKLMKDYVHSGIGKWFWLGCVGALGGLLTRKRSFIILFVFCLSFSIPFVFSNKGQIWHYVPMYPFMILLFFGFIDWLIKILLKRKFLSIFLIMGISLYFSFYQLRLSWYQFININAYISDEQILSLESSKFKEPLYIDGDFVPAAAFYSGKNIKKIEVGGISKIFSNKNSFLLITTRDRLNGENIEDHSYKVIKEDRDRVLLLKN